MLRAKFGRNLERKTVREKNILIFGSSILKKHIRALVLVDHVDGMQITINTRLPPPGARLTRDVCHGHMIVSWPRQVTWVPITPETAGAACRAMTCTTTERLRCQRRVHGPQNIRQGDINLTAFSTSDHRGVWAKPQRKYPKCHYCNYLKFIYIVFHIHNHYVLEFSWSDVVRVLSSAVFWIWVGF